MSYFLVPYSPLEQGTDVVFLIDASRGVSLSEYDLEKDFIRSLATHFNVSTTGTRGSLVIYAEHAHTIASLTDANFMRRLESATLLQTSRRMDRALEHAAMIFLKSKRNGKKIAILMTTGRQAYGAKPIQYGVASLRSLEVETYVVAIGGEADRRELASIVEKPNDIRIIPSFEQLPSETRPISRYSEFLK